MPVNLKNLRAAVQALDWEKVFRSSLRWTRPTDRVRTEVVDGEAYTLTPIADTGGMQIYVVRSPDGTLPPRPTRNKIETRLQRTQVEHILIFQDDAKTQAVLQWVKRGQEGRRAREFAYRRGASGELLIQKLQGIAFDINDFDAQGRIEITKVTERVRKNLDVDAVTKRFYRDFDGQRKDFQDFLQGIPLESDQRWYVSVMLNRLMFISFIQAKGFLNRNTDYLRERLAWSKKHLGEDRYYQGFLRVLFFEGFALEPGQRSAEVKAKLGTIPYLNGGLFLPHEIEERYKERIDIPDAAFEKLFAFFSSWRWHLSERPGAEDREIDPDVLGYIFEKYINQKQMGAYYTRDDITGYICRNTIIPALFDKASLSLTPLNLPATITGYIYPAMKQEKPLPGETEREVVARRAHVATLVADAQTGKIATINDAVTANLDLEEVLQNLVPHLDAVKIYDLYTALAGDPRSGKLPLSILDPTVGSGAFLFAALRILKPIYEAVLTRMDELVEAKQAADQPLRDVLVAAEEHSNRDYFVTKSIVVRNLYGVDLMAEATEICKLRLFLRMVADLEDAQHIEPLPDIDFNIRAGNALVGYARPDEIGLALRQGVAGLNPRQQRLLDEIKGVQRELTGYRNAQLQFNPSAAKGRAARKEIYDRLKAVNDGLDNDLLKIGQIHKETDGNYNTSPFHWFTAFYEILSDGGFDVIVGNPPYVEYSQVKGDRKIGDEDRYRIHGYKTEGCGNIYAYVMERCLSMITQGGRQGFIVPVSSISTERYNSLQVLLSKRDLHYSSYDDRPSRLFDGLEHIRLTIHLVGHSSSNPSHFSTRYNKWSSVQREALFDTLVYTPASSGLVTGSMPKLSSPVEGQIVSKLEREGKKLFSFYTQGARHRVFYSRKVGYFLQILDFEPLVLDGNGNKRPPSEFKEVNFQSDDHAKAALCCLNSSLFYWFITVFSDCRHVNKREVDSFPIDLNKLSRSTQGKKLVELAVRLMANIQRNSEQRQMRFKHDTLTIQFIYPKFSKPIIDEIDRVLAVHYGFTPEELDFIINYDIKYRLGRDADDSSDDE